MELLCLCVLLFVSHLLAFHIFLRCKGMSTFEWIKKGQVRRLVVQKVVMTQ